MSVNYTISGGGTIMTFDAGVTEILQADVQTYTQYLDLTTIVIPTSVVTICGTTIDLNPFTTDGAFSSMPNLTTVTINTPSSLQVIGKGAFAEDIGITGITLPAGLLYIGDAAFLSSTQHYPGMTINTIPSSVTYIGPYAFYADNGNVAFANLSTLPSAITVISEYAFYYVSIPTTLTIPSTVLDISNNAFPAVAFNGGTGSDCGLILSSGLKNIFSYAFGVATFSGTLALIIPPSTRLIGQLAFTSTNLTNITYTSTTTLGADPFPPGATITILPGPNPPTDLSGNWNPSSIALLWTAPTQTGATPVAYYLITDTSDSIIYQTPNSNTNYTVTGTDPNTIYTYTIQTVNQEEAVSAASTSISAGPPPNPPTNLSTTPSYGSLILNWTAPTQTGGGTITNYNIINQSTFVTITTPDPTPSYTVTGLSGGILYTYALQTVTNIATSADSSDVSGIPLFPIGPPTNVSATANILAILLNWTASIYTGGYPIDHYIITNVGADTSFNTPTADTSYNITSLTANVRYIYHIQSVNTNGDISVASSDVSAVPLPPSLPSPPTNVAATGRAESVYLTWTAPTNTGGFSISAYIVTDTSTDISTNTMSSATNYTVTGLTVGQSYTYVIQTLNSYGDLSIDSSSATAVARSIYPDPPTNLRLLNYYDSGSADDYIQIRFTPPVYTGNDPYISSYLVTDVSNGISIATSIPIFITPPPFSFYGAPNGLISGTTYNFVIQAVNGLANFSVDSSSVFTIYMTPQPDPPTYVSYTPYVGYVVLNWGAPTYTGDGPVSYYVIEVDNSPIYTTDASTSYTLTLPYGSYAVNVQTVNTLNAISTVVGTTVQSYAVPNPPTNLTILEEFIGLYLEWTAPDTTYTAPIDYYRITDVSSGTTYQAYDVSYNVYPLRPSTIYTYNVRTVDTLGNASVPTPDISGIPLTPPLPDPPSNLEASGIILGVYLSWTAPPDTGGGPAIYYIITNVTTSTTINTPNADTSYNVTGLSPGFSYTFQVQTVDVNGDTSPTYAGPVSATPLAPPFPDYPTDILAVPETLYIYLSWTPPANEGGGPPLIYNVRETDTNTSTTTLYTTANAYFLDLSANNTTHSYTFTLQTADKFGRTSGQSPATSAVSPYGLPSPPLNLTASGEILSVYLTWDVPTTIGQTAVAYYIITNVTTDSSFNTPNADTSYNVLDLSANVAFTFKTQMVNTGGYISGFSNTAIGTPFEPPPPNPPTDISAVGQADSIYLSWTPPVNTGGGPVAYYIITDVINDISYNTMSNNSFYTVTGLNVGQLYTYYIQTVDTYFDPALNTSVPSASVSATPVSAPNPPTDLSSGNFYFTNNNATAGFNIANQYSGIFTWTAPTFTGGFPISYYILTCTTITYPDPPLPISYQTPNADTSFNITLITGPLLNGINPFVCSIKTVNSNGDSSIDSSSITFNSPDFQTPDPAIDLSAVGLVDSIYVSWQPPVYTGNAPISYYGATYFGDTSSNSGIIPGGWGSTLSFQVLSVYNLFNYPAGGSGPSAIVTATAIAPPLTDVSAVGFLSPPAAYPPGAIYITWQYPFVSVYNYAEITDISSGLVYTTELNENFFTIDSTNFPDISTNTVYNYAIKGYIYNGGTETYATTNNSYVSAMIYLPNPPDPPTDLSGYATSYNSLYLQWVAPVNTGGSAIRLYYIRNTITGAINTSLGTDTSYNMLFSGTTRIQGDTLYTFVVVAVTVLNLESSDSNPVTIRTPQSPPPGPPVALVAQSYTPTSIQLNWYPPLVDGKNPIAYYIITNVTTGYSYPQTMGPEPTQAIIIDQGDPGFTPLQQRVLYTFYIVTVDDHDLSSVPSASVSAMLIPRPLLPPENIVAVSAPNSIILRWDTQINTGTSDLYYYLITDISSGRTYRSYPPYPAPFYQPEFIVFNLSAGIPYTFYIQTVNTGLQISVPSTTITATPLEGPYPPTNIVATGLLESIYLTWDAAIIPPTSGFFYQYIITDVSSGETYRTPTYDPSVLSYTITNLQPAVARTYYIQTAFDSFVGIINSVPSPNVSAIPLPPFPDPPTNTLAYGYVNSILLFWTPPPDTSGYNAYFYIVNTGDPGEYYTTDNATISNYNILGLDAGFTAIYEIKTIDLFDQSSNYAVFNSATAIPKIPLILNISGESVQTIPFMGTPIIPWYVTSIIIPSPYNAPPYPPNPVTGTPIFVYTDTLGNVLPDLPNSNGFYNVYAYISPNDPYYTGRSDTYTIFVKIALPQLLDCSPALTLNALSHGGNFSSAITTAIGKQMSNTTVAAKVFTQTSAPVCCSTSPSISPFSGGTTSGTQTNALIQNQALCTYNQNLAVAKLRQIPGCPIDNAQRFAKYQRFPSAEANCMAPVIITGLPTAVNGPCTNVIGISQTSPYT